MKLAFIGIGKVGFALANNFQQSGHDIIIAHDDVTSNSVLRAQERNPSFQVFPIQEAITTADVIFLAIPFNSTEALLKPLDFGDKILVDCTNPVGAGISHGLGSKVSGAEKIQEWTSNAKVVKSYTIYGFENLENPVFPNYGVKPVMPISGNDVNSKAVVSTLNSDLGFETLDVGDLSQSLHLEHMTLLWVKMVRANGHHPNFTWAYLER
ncbi:NADPH-dependent F420 reductase [Muricauda sp. SCSIO 64092]|uniref:NADPH-dependent F420 reductase n=1 Tax=Allomuricauda sp. SCSIO 64092 TaxID=2908842 RepID=UPI001FF32363|nr:NADPH-dependent F420 reductase [Muricauda sp. SCSIO 64092]UOY06871.1 NADPH-dependent F420 reductase [Muricauda sp. SCSIO 64092]